MLSNNDVKTIGDFAIGSVGPVPRVATGEIELYKVDELSKRLGTAEYYEDVSDTLGPNAAGGTFSLVVADALSGSRFRKENQTAEQHTRMLYSWLLQNKNNESNRRIIPRSCVDGRLPVSGTEINVSIIGTHDDNHGASGCGSQNKLQEILTYICEREDDLRNAAHSIGIDVDIDTSLLLSRNAGSLLESGYISSGAELRAASAAVAGEGSVTKLVGEHCEVVIAINTVPDKTVNRNKIRDDYGSRYEVFGVDVGLFKEAASVIADSDVESVYSTYIAMLYYNLATLFVLGHSSLRVSQYSGQ